MNNYYSQDIADAIKTKVAFYIEKSKTIFPNFTINMPEVDFDISSIKIAGRAYGSRKISFNPQYFSQADFWNTVIGHEVAHIVTKIVYPNAKQAHGPEFRYVMRVFGLNDSTYHSMVIDSYVEKYKYSYTCPCGGKFNLSACLHKKVQSGKNRICRKCRGRITFVTTTAAAAE